MSITNCVINNMAMETDTKIFAYAVKNKLMFLGVDASEFKTVEALVDAINKKVLKQWGLS